MKFKDGRMLKNKVQVCDENKRVSSGKGTRQA